MGIEDRDYMRPATPGWQQWVTTTSICNRLILVNVGVFVLIHLLSIFVGNGRAHDTQLIQDHFTVSWDGVVNHWRVWTLLTSAFAHIDPWHILFNMLFLYILGELEQYYGSWNTALLYLYAGTISSLAHICYQHFASGLDQASALGASGAIAGFLVVALFYFPNRKILLFMVIPAPLWVCGLVFFAADTLGVLHDANTGIAHAAHLGGALAGLTFKTFDLRLFPSQGQYGQLGAPRLRRPSWLTGPAQPRPKVLQGDRSAPPASAVPPINPAPPTTPATKIDAETSSRLDDLLRKIAKEGLDSLTPEEKTFLDTASARLNERK